MAIGRQGVSGPDLTLEITAGETATLAVDHAYTGSVLVMVQFLQYGSDGITAPPVPVSVTDSRGNTYTPLVPGSNIYRSTLTTPLAPGDVITVTFSTGSGATNALVQANGYTGLGAYYASNSTADSFDSGSDTWVTGSPGVPLPQPECLLYASSRRQPLSPTGYFPVCERRDSSVTNYEPAGSGSTGDQPAPFHPEFNYYVFDRLTTATTGDQSFYGSWIGAAGTIENFRTGVVIFRAAAGAQPVNLHRRFEGYHVAEKGPSGIRIRTTPHSIPPFEEDHDVTTDPSDEQLDIAIDHRKTLWLLFRRAGVIYEKRSTDGGATWTAHVSLFASGRHPVIEASPLPGAPVVALCYVSGTLKGRRRYPGDAAWGAEFTLKGPTGVNLAVDDDSFDLSPAPDGPQRWLLVATSGGMVKHWQSVDDAETWTEVAE